MKTRRQGLAKALVDSLLSRNEQRGDRNSPTNFQGSGRVRHNEFGTGTVVSCRRAEQSDARDYSGDIPFEVGMSLCLVDWDDGGTSELLVSTDELVQIPD